MDFRKLAIEQNNGWSLLCWQVGDAELDSHKLQCSTAGILGTLSLLHYRKRKFRGTKHWPDQEGGWSRRGGVLQEEQHSLDEQRVFQRTTGETEEGAAWGVVWLVRCSCILDAGPTWILLEAAQQVGYDHTCISELSLGQRSDSCSEGSSVDGREGS